MRDDAMKILETERLILRTWREEDAQPFVLINRDQRVMEHLPKLLTAQESLAMICSIKTRMAHRGFGLWAVALKEPAEFIGFIGLSVPRFKTAFTPCVEVAWRLSAQHWGQGYAPEGAKAAINHGFVMHHLKEIVAFTVPENSRSLRVMQKIGMQRDQQGDFAHPHFPSTHRLSKHVLYRIGRS